MPFSITQYETAVGKVSNGVRDLRSIIPQINLAASIALSRYAGFPDFVKNAIRWCADRLTALLSEIAGTIADLTEGMVVPVKFFVDAYAWQEVRTQATGVSTSLRSASLSVDNIWSGRARDAYVEVIPAQSEAADRIAKVANRTAQALTTCALAGAAFYVGLGLVLCKLIPAALTAVAALESAVFSWAGVALIFEEASIDTGLTIAFWTTLTAMLDAQASEMVALHGENAGKWPDPVTATYGDATVKDGDADWSLR